MDSLHSISNRQKKQIEKFEEHKPKLDLVINCLNRSKLLNEEEKEHLEFSLKYIIHIMNKYKLSEGLDF
jgi:Flp pilus assembly CpaE family ATPase